LNGIGLILASLAEHRSQATFGAVLSSWTALLDVRSSGIIAVVSGWAHIIESVKASLIT
jgi:hypothetical protein